MANIGNELFYWLPANSNLHKISHPHNWETYNKSQKKGASKLKRLFLRSNWINQALHKQAF